MTIPTQGPSSFAATHLYKPSYTGLEEVQELR